MTTAEASIEGVLPVDKPVGPTSHDIVAAARRALRTRRVGHTGTLDPFASGLLLLCSARATRIAEYLSGMDKSYRAVVRLGVATDTDDHTGAVIGTADAAAVERTAVEGVLAGLRGAIMQVPPAYSAKKRGGERAYAAARSGRVLVLDPVAVEIYELEILAFEPPLLTLHVRCSSGTYIRAIARDIGRSLGMGAHLSALRRTAIGTFSVEDALPADSLTDHAAVLRSLLSPVQAIAALNAMPIVQLDAADIAAIRHGRAITAAGAARGTVALVARGELIAIADAGDDDVRPRKVFA
jgi:tRNA pseudouridine55 synthase